MDHGKLILKFTWKNTCITTAIPSQKQEIKETEIAPPDQKTYSKAMLIKTRYNVRISE